MLINNAAVARYGALVEQPLDEVKEVFDADVFGLLALSQVRHVTRSIQQWRHADEAVHVPAIAHASSTPDWSAWSAPCKAIIAGYDAAQAVSKEMIKQRSGAILNIGSVSANLTRPFAGDIDLHFASQSSSA